MKSVVEINVACNWGSTGRIVEQIGLCAKRKGWLVYLAHGGRYVNSSQLNTYQIQGKAFDFIHYIWNSALLGHSGLGSKHHTARFLKCLEEINPSIVHLHNIHGYFINYQLLLDYLASKKIPVIWTLHDCWPITGHCTYFDDINCEKWKTECNKCKLIHDYPKSLLFDTSQFTFQLKKSLISSIQNITFVPVSRWLGKIIEDSAIGRDADIQVIHNGIDLETFKPIPRRREGDSFRILGVAAGYGKRKGLDDFNKLREILGADYEITMVGLTGDEIKRIAPGIRGIKQTESLQDLVALYNEADVYVNPTYSDNFPTTNIEALACGTPVVTYDTGGSPEAIDDNTGIVVEQGNILALSKAIEQIKNHPLDSNSCRARAEKLFDNTRCFEEYVQLYDRITGLSND